MVQQSEPLLVWLDLAVERGESHCTEAKGRDFGAMLAEFPSWKLWRHAKKAGVIDCVSSLDNSDRLVSEALPEVCFG